MQRVKQRNIVKNGLINRHVLIEITKRCNLNCRHCFTAAGEKIAGEISLDEWRMAAVDLINSGFDAFTISGGEPMLEFEKAVALTNELKRLNNRVKVYLFTNGLLVDEKKAKEIKTIFNGVMVSLDGDEESHDWLRRKKGCFQSAVKALKIFKKFGVATSLQSMVTEKNIASLKNLVVVANKYGVKAIRLSHVDLFGRAREYESNLKPSAGFLKNLDRKISQLKNKKIFLTSNLVTRENFLKNKERYRQPSLHILPNGSVLPWYGFPSEYELIKYPKESFGKLTKIKLAKRLDLFYKLLNLAEKKVTEDNDTIVAYDNVIAGYLFNNTGGKKMGKCKAVLDFEAVKSLKAKKKIKVVK